MIVLSWLHRDNVMSKKEQNTCSTKRVPPSSSEPGATEGSIKLCHSSQYFWRAVGGGFKRYLCWCATGFVIFINFKNLFIKKKNLLAEPHSTCDLSSLTRDQTHTPRIGSAVLTPGLPGKSLFVTFIYLFFVCYFYKQITEQFFSLISSVIRCGHPCQQKLFGFLDDC